MRIPWKLKSAGFAVIDATQAYGLLGWFHRNVSKRSRIRHMSIHEDWLFHAAAIAEAPGKRVLEFGAGKSLAQNIYLSTQGIEQTVVDVVAMFEPALANQAAQQISLLIDMPLPEIQSIDDLERYNIRYLAPLDVAMSGLGENAFDACISTNTLEHIPVQQIEAIFRELGRLLVPGGVLSAQIDYTDHYSHTDRSIGRLNYLQFTEAEFKKFNHSCHYQNRLRHDDYLKLLSAAKFEIVSHIASGLGDLPAKIAADDCRTQNAYYRALGGKIVARLPTGGQ